MQFSEKSLISLRYLHTKQCVINLLKQTESTENKKKKSIKMCFLGEKFLGSRATIVCISNCFSSDLSFENKSHEKIS